MCQVWQDFKDDMQTVLTEDDYEKRMKEYMASGDYRENDIEQLLVYFTFRYIMNAIYDSNIMVYAYLSVMFTMIVRDMNATRFYKNGGSFTIRHAEAASKRCRTLRKLWLWRLPRQ